MTRLRALAGARGSITAHRDVALYAALVAPGDRRHHSLAPARAAWRRVMRGAVTLNGSLLSAGDGATIDGEPRSRSTATKTARSCS